MPITVPKPWGQEIILTDPNLPYTGKIATTKAGHRWSLQYHDQKTETLILLSGQGQLTLNDQTINMEINRGYHILPMTKHRFQAITDSTTIEISTPETGTTFRLEDDYHRSNETSEIRNSPNRGWHAD